MVAVEGVGAGAGAGAPSLVAVDAAVASVDDAKSPYTFTVDPRYPPSPVPIFRSRTGRQRPIPRWVKWVLRRLKVKLVDVTLRYESVGMCPLQASGS